MEGYKVCIARQDAGKSQTLIEELQMAGIDIEAFSVDARKEGEVPPVRKGDFADVPRLLWKYLFASATTSGATHNASQSCCAVPPHHVQARGVQLGNNVKAPFQPQKPKKSRLVGGTSAFCVLEEICPGQVSDDARNWEPYSCRSARWAGGS